MNTRISIRSFCNKTVPFSLVEEIIRYAHSAPSSCNLQLTDFVYINNSDILAKLASQCSKKFNWSSQWILVLSDSRITFERKANTVSSGIAIGYLLSKAHELDVATCPIAGFVNDPFIKKLLGIPQYYNIDLAIAIGYPEKPQANSITKKSIKRISKNYFKDIFTFSTTSACLSKWSESDVDSYRSRIFPVYSKRGHVSPFPFNITSKIYPHRFQPISGDLVVVYPLGQVYS